MKLPSWAVAAAILVIDRSAWHYQALAQRVVETNLSNLGRFGKTPAKTLRVDIIENHSDIFDYSWSRGYYELRDEIKAIADPQVQLAVSKLIGPELEEYACKVRAMVVQRSEASSEEFERTGARIRELESLFHRVCGIESRVEHFAR